jgi:hypothetical protein
MEAQKADLGLEGLGRQKEVSWKYIDFRMAWMWLLGFSAILQAAERMSPWLKAYRFQIPRPPFDFGAQMFFLATRHKGFEEGSEEIPATRNF